LEESSVKFGFATIGVAVNVDLTEGNSEESVFSPSLGPGVGADPVVGSIVISPTDDLNGVTTLVVPELGGLLVDTRLVAEEVLVDLETGFNWTTFKESRLDLFGVSGINSRSLFAFVGLELSTIWAGVNWAFAFNLEVFEA
jgi:hypothetical protein